MYNDEFFMEQALSEARKGKGAVLPNPMVGAVIVREDRIIGRGHHARYGGIHAEPAALEDCREDPKGATLYVTLEPCCHRGEGKHNPPCTEAILRAGIARVVVARTDPNPRVAGQGLDILREQGVSVRAGVLEDRAAGLNRVYETLIRYRRPFVHLKAALTLDGFLAARDGSSRWISSPASRERVMAFRLESDAVLTGRGTLFADNPSLTVRNADGTLREGTQPRRVFLSSAATLPAGWLSEKGPGRSGGAEVLVYHTGEERFLPGAAAGTAGIVYRSVGTGPEGLDLQEVLTDLPEQGVRTLLVEGGSRVFGSFLRQGLWDRLTVFQAPDLLGEGIPFSDGAGIGTMKDKLVLQNLRVEPVGRDVMISGYREALTCSQG